MHDTFGIPSGALIRAAKEKGIKLSKTAASALIHRMTGDQFHNLRLLKDKEEALSRNGGDSSQVEKQILGLLLIVSRSLIKNPLMIDPAFPSHERSPEEGAKVQREIEYVLSQFAQ